jgi:hypothetical protein
VTFRNDTLCRLCQGPLVTVLDLPPTPPANALLSDTFSVVDAYPLAVAQCTACEHVQLSSVVSPDVLFTESYPYASGTSPVFEAHLKRLAHEVSSHLRPGALVVEIGSNDGSMLRHLGTGIRRLGIDPALGMARHANANHALTVPEFFSWQMALTIRAAMGPADAVVALNVAAHTPDLDDMFRGIAYLLDDRGTLIIEVGYLPDVIATNNVGVVYHEHPSMWHLRPMLSFLRRFDLHMFDAQRIDTQGGSVRVYATKGIEIKESATLLELLENEAATLPEAVLTWRNRVEIATSHIRDTIKGLKRDGKTIAGFGAAAKAVTLLAACGLTGQDIDFVADDNPHKQGKFLPGSYIPILPASTLAERNPDYVLILAGNFSESIRECNPGPWKWIEPLPEVRIL